MIIEDTIIESTLKNLLQKDIKFYIKGKCTKSGKLLLFKQNNYHLELTLQRKDGEMKRFEIPIPYNIESWKDDNLVYFDYRLSTLAKGNNKLLKLLTNMKRDGNSKFYDVIVEVEILGEANG